MRFPLSGLLFLLLVVPPVVAQQNSQHTLPNSPKGFDKQYKNAFNAYEKAFKKKMESVNEKTFPKPDLCENALSVYRTVFRRKNTHKNAFIKGGEEPMERFRTFAIPEHWFADVFGPNQGPELAREYQELFNGFAAATEHEFSMLAGREYGDAYLATKAWRTNTQLKSARSAPASLVPLPPVQRFRIWYYVRSQTDINDCRPMGTIDCTGGYGGYGYSRVDAFIYMDGAFRFIGGGACPFWATPCSPNLPLWLPNWGFTSD
jgi:hypothetical protein